MYFYQLTVSCIFSHDMNNLLKSHGSGGIRTHASEETGALNQRLRPLGHATDSLYDLSMLPHGVQNGNDRKCLILINISKLYNKTSVRIQVIHMPIKGISS